MDAALIVVAVSFCVLTGANDGAALVSMSARVAPDLLRWSLAFVVAAVVVVPLATTAVADTLARRLVDTRGAAGEVPALAAIVAAIVVVGVLARRGEPTSLTLALVGGLAGAGAGASAVVDGALLARVMGIAALAPVIAMLLASALTRILARVRMGSSSRPWVRGGHRVMFGIQAAAYATNDGQKMVAVLALAVPGVLGTGRPDPLALVGIGLLFLIGTLVGLRSVGRTLTSGVVRVRPVAAVITEASAATAVLASSLVAAPVSMTQSITGAACGTDVISGYRGVRLRVLLRVVRSWLVTLPAAFVLSGILSLVIIGLLP